MCGRFAITLPSDAMAQLFDAKPANNLPDVPNFNIRPTNLIHVITADQFGRKLETIRWGFVPVWYKKINAGPLLINARSCLLYTSPSPRDMRRSRMPSSA